MWSGAIRATGGARRDAVDSLEATLRLRSDCSVGTFVTAGSTNGSGARCSFYRTATYPRTLGP
jgi:hypothetical protein